MRLECNGDAQDAGYPADVVGTGGNHGDDVICCCCC